MIPVKFDKLLFSNMGFVILLKAEEDDRTLPIFIGTVEAQSIALFVSDVKIPRPLTHDLLKNVLENLDCDLKRIEVCDLRDGTFIARLILICNGEEIEVDSRPSDAIALALRTSSPIFVAEKVMDEAGRVLPEAETELSGLEEKAEEKSPLEVLKKDLDKAVEDERYEDAAKIRDEIKKLENLYTDN
ncbi:MAG: bifunctional nuclease family protein [Spirochaetota bacterium]|nr:MAG: bifunctional nuclease family protein [Spirochaetota bacterium]